MALTVDRVAVEQNVRGESATLRLRVTSSTGLDASELVEALTPLLKTLPDACAAAGINFDAPERVEVGHLDLSGVISGRCRDWIMPHVAVADLEYIREHANTHYDMNDVMPALARMRRRVGYWSLVKYVLFVLFGVATVAWQIGGSNWPNDVANWFHRLIG